MAYCNKCGAYIPDGKTVCLACGHDMEEEKAQAEQAQAAQAQAQAAQAQAQSAQTQTAPKEEKKHAYDDSANYYSFSNEELREKLEEQRKKQQEQSRKWAEQEKHRRERESVKDNWKTYTTTRKSTPHTQTQSKSTGGWNSTRLMSVLSYVSLLFLIPMLFKSEDKKAGFHARQGLRLFIYSVLCDAATSIPVIGTLLQISRIYLMIKGIINAINDKEEPLPFIGTIGGKN